MKRVLKFISDKSKNIYFILFFIIIFIAYVFYKERPLEITLSLLLLYLLFVVHLYEYVFKIDMYIPKFKNSFKAGEHDLIRILIVVIISLICLTAMVQAL